MTVPIERDCPVFRQNDLITIVAAMARTQFPSVRRCRFLFNTSEQLSSSARERLSQPGYYSWPSFNSFPLLGYIRDSHLLRGGRAKTLQPLRGALWYFWAHALTH